MLARIRNSLLTLFYPQPCHVCGSPVDDRADGVACADCWRQVRFCTGLETTCAKCGALLSDGEPLYTTYCHECDEQRFDRARWVGVYHNAMAASILQMKKQPHLPARLRSRLLEAFAGEFRNETDLLVPVPLSPLRRLERGFNQAEVIADAIAQGFSVPVDRNSLIRKVHTPKHRTAMDRRARERTVEHAFKVVRPRLVRGSSILLVDDILTSGATASYCAHVLKKSGAATVNVLTVARAVRYR